MCATSALLPTGVLPRRDRVSMRTASELRCTQQGATACHAVLLLVDCNTRHPQVQGLLAPGLHFAALPRDAGPGVYGSLPLDTADPQAGASDAALGLRYAAPGASAGVTLRPLQATLDQAWCLLRHSPEGSTNTHVTIGWQTAPAVDVRTLLEADGGPARLIAAEATSAFAEYQSGAADSYFSVALESVQARATATCAGLPCRTAVCRAFLWLPGKRPQTRVDDVVRS
jgi:hypothetical protein